MSDFDPRTSAAFHFLDADYADGVARFRYQFDGGTLLCETVRFPGALAVPPERATAFARALNLAHLVIGVSYYKAGVPPRMECQTPPDPQLAELLDALYLNGLGEFAHVNGLDLRERIRFPRGAADSRSLSGVERFDSAQRGGADHRSLSAVERFDAAQRDWADHRSLSEVEGNSMIAAPVLGLPARAIAAIGGGKDSLVTIEDLKTSQVPTCVAWIGHSELIRATAAATGLPTLNLERQIDPQLFAYNRAGAYNGHIPVTAINSSLLLLAALLYGYDRVVFSNEASADSPNLTQASGFAVNHQWSKGAVFETLLHDYVHAAIASDLRYYSHLRGLSELKIIRRFAALTQYHPIFSSCNRNFKLLGERPESRWCGECPKCLFVFLGLAPYLAKPALTAIFGRNLLDDPALQPGFEALVELGGRHKPFECVGDVSEARTALRALSGRADWAEDAIVRELGPRI